MFSFKKLSKSCIMAGLFFYGAWAQIGQDALIAREDVGGNFSDFNHGSTVAETKNGVLVIAWYGGRSEGSSSTRIWVSCKENSSGNWSDGVAVDVNGEDGSSCWNPVLFQPEKDGAPLLLYYKYGGNPNTWKGVVRTSTDDGLTWSDRTLLPDCSNPYPLCNQYGNFGGPAKDKPLELPDGSLLLGGSTEENAFVGWSVHVEKTSNYIDDLVFVQEIDNNVPPEKIGTDDWVDWGCIQPFFLPHDGNCQTIQIIARTVKRGANTSFSYDGGQTWTPMMDSALILSPNNEDPRDFPSNQGFDGVRLPNGHFFTIYSDHGRREIAGAISGDGLHWEEVIEIELVDWNRDSRYCDYPSVIAGSDNMLHCSYGFEKNGKIIYSKIDWQQFDYSAVAVGKRPISAAPAGKSGFTDKDKSWFSAAGRQDIFSYLQKNDFLLYSLDGQCINSAGLENGIFSRRYLPRGLYLAKKKGEASVNTLVKITIQ
ncbi:MAG: hypothetical protein GF401_03660 [Chitinivibrionales bacterium]|nr:hypothetical protein [Chitinivibrionales bacterium]